MNNLTNDYIVIDTNIFIGLFNPQENKDDHIEILLNTLQEDCICLIVDEGGKIWGEYTTSIVNQMANGQKNSGYNELIRAWINPDRCKKIVPVDANAMNSIKEIIGINKTKDATFVCVTMVSDKTLITNDRADIIDRGTRSCHTRNELLKLAKRKPYRRRSFRIWDSKEAHGKL